MNYFNLLRKASVAVSGLSAGYIVGSIIKNNVVPTTRLEKGLHIVGSLVIGGLVTSAVEAHVDGGFAATEEWWKKFKEEHRTELETEE